VHPVRHGLDQRPEKVAGHALRDLLVQLHEGELGGAIDGHQQVEPALLGPDLGDVDVEVADRVSLELAPAGLLALGVRQPADAIPLETAVQR